MGQAARPAHRCQGVQVNDAAVRLGLPFPSLAWTITGASGSGKSGRMLRADLASVIQGPRVGVWGSSFPTPGAVRAIIDYALNFEWDPAATGGHYELQAAAGTEIPGFHDTVPRH